MMRNSLSGCSLLLFLLPVSCTDDTPSPTRPKRDRPLVYATLHPLQFFAQRLAGDFLDCELALPEGEDPQHWIPNRELLAKLATADMVILHGELESWQNKVGLPRSRQSIVTTGFQDHFIKIENAITHTHGGKSHTHDGVDPYLWLDLDLAAKEAEVVARALKFVLASDTATQAIDENLAALQRDLTKEHAAQRKLTIPGGRICTTAGVYAYWARSVGAQPIPLDLHSEKGIAAARTAAKQPECRLALCPTPPDATQAKLLEELGLTPIVFDPCFTVPAGKDFLMVMRDNRTRLRAALGK